jgi:hypothetical protein
MRPNGCAKTPMRCAFARARCSRTRGKAVSERLTQAKHAIHSQAPIQASYTPMTHELREANTIMERMRARTRFINDAMMDMGVGVDVSSRR